MEFLLKYLTLLIKHANNTIIKWEAKITYKPKTTKANNFI